MLARFLMSRTPAERKALILGRVEDILEGMDAGVLSGVLKNVEYLAEWMEPREAANFLLDVSKADGKEGFAILSSLRFRPRRLYAVSAAQEPPRAARFLMLLIPPRNREGMMGDLEEEFRAILLPQYGLRLAQFYYWWHAIIACGFSVFAAFRALSQSMRRN
jgi:hypothetical protein